MSVIPELEPPFNTIVIENEAGTYKDFHLEPGDTYPLAGVTYPVDYGYLPGYTGEDGHELDIFVGTDVAGKLGHFTVWRGDVPEEHKYYVAMTDAELGSVLDVFAPVLLKNTTMECTLTELLLDLERFKNKAYRFIWKIRLGDHVTDEEFIKHWHDASEIVQEYPGARGTLIHKARDEDRTYFLVAEWESRAARDAMQAEVDAGQTERAKRWQQFPANDAFGDIQVVMAGEEIGAVTPK